MAKSHVRQFIDSSCACSECSDWLLQMEQFGAKVTIDSEGNYIFEGFLPAQIAFDARRKKKNRNKNANRNANGFGNSNKNQNANRNRNAN
jgi:hypothetical protein